MPRSGGVYSLPAGSIVADGTTATAAQHNTPLNDIAADLNAARPIGAGGTGATTAGGARTALDVQQANARLADIAGLQGSFVRGDVLYYDGTNLVRLPKGSTGQVLTQGADDPAWTFAAGQKILAWNWSSTVTTIDVTDLAGWDAVRIEGTFGGGGNVGLQVSPDNGATWRTTGYSGVIARVGQTDLSWTTAMGISAGAPAGLQFTADVHAMSEASQFTACVAHFHNSLHGSGLCRYSSTEVCTALRFTASTNITSGYFNVYGVRRA